MSLFTPRRFVRSFSDDADQLDAQSEDGADDCPCGGAGCRRCDREIAVQERAEDIGDRMREEAE